MAKKKKGRLPEGSEWYRIRSEIRAQSDRGAAIIAGAMVQDCLKHRLLTSLIDPLDDDIAGMFERAGPLTSFWSQITLAYGTGLVGTNLRDDLHRIRDIRNKFAHGTQLEDPQQKMQQLAFESQLIANWCQNLALANGELFKMIEGKRTPVSSCRMGNNADKPRERYTSVCFQVVGGLISWPQPGMLECEPFRT